jgi:zinc protease
MQWVKSTFGQVPASSETIKPASASDPFPASKDAHVELDKEQIGIYLGGPLPGSNSPDATSLTVATSILSSRLYLNLREKQGLAYSTGAGSGFDPDFGWYYCSIGTAAENYQKALDGLFLQIDKLKLDGPSQAEVDRARNVIWGRLMSAKLSRINQAYYLGLNEYYGRDLGNDARLIEKLSNVTVESVQRVASTWFQTNNYILTTAGKKAQ